MVKNQALSINIKSSTRDLLKVGISKIGSDFGRFRRLAVAGGRVGVSAKRGPQNESHDVIVSRACPTGTRLRVFHFCCVVCFIPLVW